MSENKTPLVEAMAIHYSNKTHPVPGVRIGSIVVSLKQAEAYALEILDACGQGRAWEQADPLDLTCGTCGHTWATKAALGSKLRCQNKSCRQFVRVPIPKKGDAQK